MFDCKPSLKLTCSMLPVSPSPWIRMTSFTNCGKSFGRRVLESMIKALNMRDGATGDEYSSVKVETPIVNLLDAEITGNQSCD